MLTDPQLIKLAILAAAVTFAALLLSNGWGSTCNCVVHISGESVRITGCEFTKDFIGYAKTLRVANNKE
ncbi:triple gene block protein 3 [Coleus vein necrosis virus]|uniref:Movement protein TGBp3 n=1 Tax=Coleus vein necrosis virus TaxID=404404 RepID=A7TZS0_9VIRU|nr:triple gene block protein 3 [Coleus vein necrosis virus]ABS89248.1 triple gene block protein 3 [Coleus vein necrosis virus]